MDSDEEEKLITSRFACSQANIFLSPCPPAIGNLKDTSWCVAKLISLLYPRQARAQLYLNCNMIEY